MISQEVLQFKDTFTFYMLSYQKDWSPQNSFMYWYWIIFREDLSQSAYKFYHVYIYVHKCTDKWCDILVVKWKTTWNHIYRYILCILTSYVKKSTPELEEALLLVRSLRGTCTSNDLLTFWLYRHLLYKYKYLYMYFRLFNVFAHCFLFIQITPIRMLW